MWPLSNGKQTIQMMQHRVINVGFPGSKLVLPALFCRLKVGLANILGINHYKFAAER